MKLIVTKIGRPTTKEVRTLVDMYSERLRPFLTLESVELKETGKNRNSKVEITRQPDECLIVLDEKGKQWSSLEWSNHLREWMDDRRIKSVRFVIGGPYGLDPSTIKSAHHVCCLSKMTLPSDLAWLLTWEQLFRAMSILKGTPYHHA